MEKMETAVQKGMNSFFGFLVEAAPALDANTRCLAWWGEPDYPELEDFED